MHKILKSLELKKLKARQRFTRQKMKPGKVMKADKGKMIKERSYSSN